MVALTLLLPLLASAVLATPTRTTPLVAARAAKDVRFTPGVKCQIDILHPLDATKTPQPTDAVVWDLDIWMLRDHPEVVKKLKPSATKVCAVTSPVQDIYISLSD